MYCIAGLKKTGVVMKTVPGIIIVFLLAAAYSSTALDTLKIIESLDSPVPNPHAIVRENSNFLVSNMRPMLYWTDSRIRCIDSLPLSFGRVTGMTFKDDELWVVRDSTTGCVLFRIDRETGEIIDSIDFQSTASPQECRLLPWNSAKPTLWGLVYYHSHFFISYNGGWGPCILAIDVEKRILSHCCCPHPIGMKIIGDEWWCVRGTSDQGGDILATLSTTQWDSAAISSVNENHRYFIPFQAADLAYDGSNIWLVDQKNSMIHKMEGFQTSLIPGHGYMKRRASIPVLKVCNGKFRITLTPDYASSTSFFNIFDIKGRAVCCLSPMCGTIILSDCGSLPAGIYTIRFRTIAGTMETMSAVLR
jgi:hypothetical protein